MPIHSSLGALRAIPTALLLITIAACVPGGGAPKVSPKGTLQPGEEGLSASGKGPFQVVSASPQGETRDLPEIAITFSRPLRMLDATSPAPPVKIKPAIPGTWDWIGTRALRFSPEKPLPMATTFEVEISGARALDGSLLEKPYRFSFSTPRPRLLRISPYNESRGHTPDVNVQLEFNQPVEDASIQASVTLLQNKGGTISYVISRPEPGNLHRVLLTPRAPLPIHSTFTVQINESLRGTEGPLTLEKPYFSQFSTYDPLVAQFECGREDNLCRPGSWMSIRLNNQVDRAQLKKALVIEPPVKLAWPSWEDTEGNTSSLSLEGAFLPGKKYTVRLRTKVGKKSLTDIYGQPLLQEFRESFEMGDLPPDFNIGVSGEFLEPSELREIPLFSMNMNRAEVAAIPLDLPALIAFDKANTRQRSEQIFSHPSARRMTMTSNAARNRVQRQSLRVNDLLPNQRGPVAITARFDDPNRPPRTRILQVTDIGISAKISAQESVAWVTRLSTGTPIENAIVEVYQPGNLHPVTTVTTDAHGLAKLPADLFLQKNNEGVLDGEEEEQGRASQLIVARDGKDWAFHRASDSVYGWRYGATIEYSNQPPKLGLLFTERGIYRPGELVQIKGILRQGTTRGMATPSNKVAHARITGPDGEVISEQNVQLTAFGSFAQSVELPPGSKLGSYRIQVKLGEKKQNPKTEDESEGGEEDWSTTFTVAEFRPTEFKVTSELDRTVYLRGDQVSCTGSGMFLFGAPMANASANLAFFHQRAYFSPPGLDGHTVDDDAYLYAHPEQTSSGGQLQSESTTLNSQGSAGIKTRLTLPGQNGPELVTCETEVTDLSRQSFAGASSAFVHPGEVYAALKAHSGYFIDAGATLRPELLAVQPDGKRRAGVPGVISLLERTYGVSRQSAAGGGIHSSYTVVDREISSCNVSSTLAPATCDLRVPQGGHYIVRATVVDSRGNKVSSSQHIYALGNGGGGWRDQDDGSLTLVTDKKTYRVGDTAKILVQSPFSKAEALVTIEREGILSQKVVTLSGSTPTIEIPVTEAFLPNAFVSVLLVRGRTKKSPEKDGLPDIGAPTFRMGYAPIIVDTSNRRLKVEVKPNKQELHPGEEISVDLSVRDIANKGVRTEVTLYAVDEGVLALTGYHTPDPTEAFFASRGIQVQTLEARDAIARIARTDSGVALGLDKGLEGGSGGLGTRRDLRQTAYFNPAILTDNQGQARVSFKLPEGLSTYRIMAVATTQEDRFGSADAQVITSKPIMARPALPRILRTDDQFEAGVIVTSKGAHGPFEISAISDGLAFQEEPRRSIHITPGQSQEVRFKAIAPRAGKIKIRFDVKGEGQNDSVELLREVKIPTLLEASALYGDTIDSTGERIGDLSSLREDVGGLEVSLSPTALAGLAGGVEQLIEYPYGCTEQLTSRLVPLLPLRDLAQLLGLKLPERVDEAVRTTVSKLLDSQHDDGGFGPWHESRFTSSWLTAYALWGLSEAQRHGVPVRATAISSATRYLKKSLQKTLTESITLAERTFIVDVLAENGEPDAGAMNRLFEQRESLPLFAKAQLLHALAISKADAGAIRQLNSDLENSLRLDGNHAFAVQPESDEFLSLLDSSTRTSAMILRALVAANPAHPMASKLALGLLANRRGGHWRSTQETAWSLLALDAYRRAQEAEKPSFQARVFLGQALLTETSFQGYERLAFQSSTPMNALRSAAGEILAFEKKGDGRLFYEARLRFARKKLPTQPIESGFFVDKNSLVVTPESMSDALLSNARGLATHVNAGDLLLVNLTVVAPSDRDFVVLDDPLPAGLEPVDTSLQGASSWLRHGDSEPDESDEDTWRWETPVTRRELRDDRVVFFLDHMAPGIHRFRYLARATTMGTFVAPPTRIEEMYTPETFGQTAAATLTISPRP